MSKGKECTDHKGNRFISIKEMCLYYGVNPHTYNHRILYGASVEEALTKKASKKDTHSVCSNQSKKTLPDVPSYKSKS